MSITLLSGCGDVSHYYYSASKNHSPSATFEGDVASTSINRTSTNSSVAIQAPSVVFTNGQDLFNYLDPNEVEINLPEFGEGTHLVVGNPHSETHIEGEIERHTFDEKVQGISSLILYDINNDGYRELCYTICGGNRNNVTIYDLKNSQRLYYVEPASIISPSSYWLSLETNKLVIHRGSEFTKLDDTNDWGFLKYSEGLGVYADWVNHLDIEGFTLNLRDENMDLIRTINAPETNTRFSIILETYKTYWFCIKPIVKQSGWGLVYATGLIENNIFFAFNSEDVKLRKEDGIEPPSSDGIEFPLYFAYYDDNQWVQTTTIQILCSGYVLSLETYFN